MKRRAFLIPFAALAALSLSGASVVSNGRGLLSYSENLPNGDTIRINFTRCMANKLFTFSDVWLNGKQLNHTESDNIGPFGIPGKGWSGGNHLNNDMRSAHHDSVRVSIDGVPFDISKAGRAEGTVLTVEAFNTLLVPAETAVFAQEKIVYNVSGNSIEVNGYHTFMNEEALTVNPYYGMQSMAIGETEILTPGGAYSTWTPIKDVDRFTKGSAPAFCLFVEHLPYGYQAAWMDPTVDLGDRHMVDSGDVVFIGNSWNKSYHKLIGNRSVKNGDSTEWHGVYTWFEEPLTDNARGGDGSYSYTGFIKGTPVVFNAEPSGKVNVDSVPLSVDNTTITPKTPFAYSGKGEVIITSDAPDAVCYNISGKTIHTGSGRFSCPAGLYIVTDGVGCSTKLIVK